MLAAWRTKDRARLAAEFGIPEKLAEFVLFSRRSPRSGILCRPYGTRMVNTPFPGISMPG